jgi:hypothetical protein
MHLAFTKIRTACDALLRAVALNLCMVLLASLAKSGTRRRFPRSSIRRVDDMQHDAARFGGIR